MSQDLVSQYTAALRIVQAIAGGERKGEACHLNGMTIARFDYMCKSDPMLAEMAYDAEAQGLEELADVVVNIDRHHTHGRTDSKMAQVVSNNIRWYLGKKLPDKYGEKVIVENRITADKAIIDALSAGLERAQNRHLLIDATPVRTTYEGPVNEEVARILKD